MLTEAEKTPTQEDIARLNNEAWALHLDNELEAFQNAEVAYRLAQTIHYTKGIRLALRTMAATALDMGLHAEAFEHATEAARLFRQAGEDNLEALMQNVLGGVHYYLGDHHSRLQCNLRGWELSRRSGDRTSLLRALNNTADTYTRLGEYDKAMTLFDECHALADDTTPFIQCIVLSNMGEVHLLQGQHTEAVTLILQSQEIGKRIDYREIVVANLTMLAQTALAEEDAQTAIHHLNEAIEAVNEYISLKDRANIHRWLSEAHAQLGDHQSALEHHRLFHSLSEEHLNEQKVKELRGIEFKQEIHTLQRTAARLEQLVAERTQELENTLADLRQKESEKQQDLEVEQAVNQFSQTLFLQNSVEDVLWDLAKNCIAKLGFEDCVIYLVDRERKELVQKAAYGPKNPIDLDILNPITIPLGQGIVGSVAQTGESEIVSDTSQDARYIIDDAMRLSEIAVPIVSGKTVLGVIDSEHRNRNFFNNKHLRILQTIASLVANRIDRIREQHERERLQSELIDQMKQNEELQTKVTRELEEKVRERTSEIDAARQRIERQAKDIRDSINYARSIQNSLLPSLSEIQLHFPEIFNLYLPRDVVSGDFYWVAKKGGRQYLAVADCTGHGVPGALVSVLCVEKLEQALLLADDPGEILRLVNNEVKRTLRQATDDGINTSRDGMDVALMAYDAETLTLSYAGAKRPLWVVREGAVTTLSPTRFSIGGHSPEGQIFEEQQFEVQSGDMVYLFSDGLTDQFGGPEGRKFGTGKFRETLIACSEIPVAQQHRHLLTLLHGWMGKEEQVDDVLVIGLRF